MDEELASDSLRLDVTLNEVVSNNEASNHQEEQRVVELLIDHVEPVVRSDSDQEKVVTIGENLGCRLQACWESVHVLQVDDGQVVAEEFLVQLGQNGVVGQEHLGLDLDIHGHFHLLELHILGVGEPTSLLLDLITVQTAGSPLIVRHHVHFVLCRHEHHHAGSDVASSFRKSQRLHAIRQDPAFLKHDGLILLSEGAVGVRSDALRTLEVVLEQLHSVVLLLLREELHCDHLLLRDARHWVQARESQHVELLAEELADLVLGAVTDVLLLKLVIDAPCHSIDDVDGESGGLILVAGHNREHVLVQVLVEKLSIEAEDSRQDVLVLGS